MNMGVIRVLIADPQYLVRMGLKTLMMGSPEFSVVGEANDGDQVISIAKAQQPDVIVLDLKINHGDCIEVIRSLIAHKDCTHILVLTNNEDDPKATAAIRAGAQGCILKETHADDLLQAIRDIADSKSPISPEIAQQLIKKYQSGEGFNFGNQFNLTKREVDVFRLVALGLSNKEIANDLAITERTVEAHVRNILKKIHVPNRTKAIIVAHQEGYLSDSGEMPLL
jgi:DNA-binding NarL/FixJ family response regulator